MTIAIVTTILVLLVIIGLGTWYSWVHLRTLRRQLKEQESTAINDQRVLVEQFTRTAQQNLEQQDTQHRQLLAAQKRVFDGERKQLKKRLNDAHNENSKLFKRHRDSVERNDWASANDIRLAATGAGLSLVVLTRLVLPNRSDTGEVFWSEIDHLVITRHQLLIIENKRWSGIVLDGVDPSSVLGDLSHVLGGAGLGSCRNAVFHLTKTSDDENKSDMTVSIRRHGDGSVRKSPTKQVRTHAKALERFLKEHGENNIQWINTAVYYSYPTAKVHHQDYNGHTSVVSTMKGLSKLLRKATVGSESIIDVKRVSETLGEYGANIIGIGDYSDLTNCPVTLQESSSSARSRT